MIRKRKVKKTKDVAIAVRGAEVGKAEAIVGIRIGVDTRVVEAKVRNPIDIINIAEITRKGIHIFKLNLTIEGNQVIVIALHHQDLHPNPHLHHLKIPVKGKVKRNLSILLKTRKQSKYIFLINIFIETSILTFKRKRVKK